MDARRERAKQAQVGFDYVFPRAGQTESKPKRGYVIGIPEWQWIVGTGVYVGDHSDRYRVRVEAALAVGDRIRESIRAGVVGGRRVGVMPPVPTVSAVRRAAGFRIGDRVAAGVGRGR